MKTNRRGFFGLVAGAAAALGLKTEAAAEPTAAYEHVYYGMSFEVSQPLMLTARAREGLQVGDFVALDEQGRAFLAWNRGRWRGRIVGVSAQNSGPGEVVCYMARNI